jgi:hypothetical protein
MRNEIKSLVEKIKDLELQYKSDKSLATKKELEYRINDLLRDVDKENSEENTFILKNILPITTSIFSGFGISEMLLEEPRMKVSKSIYGILLEKNLIKRSNIKALDYVINPKNKDLEKIFKNIVSDDDLRPTMTGLSFEGNFVTGTDAHKLLHLEGKRVGDFKDGIYKLISKVEKDYSKSGLTATLRFEEYYKTFSEIDGKYPNYIQVVPKFYSYEKQFDLHYLNDVLKTIYKNKLTNPTTNNVVFEFDTEDGVFRIGFNAEFLSDSCESLIMAGENLVDFYFTTPSKAIVILSKDKKFPTEKKADTFFKNNTFCIVMPVMIRDYYGKELEENLFNYPLIKYNDVYDFDIKIGDSPSYNLIEGENRANSKKEAKTQAKTESKADLYKQLIEGYELALEMETNKEKIKMYQDLIEGYKLLLDL